MGSKASRPAAHTEGLVEQLREVVRPSVCGDGYDAKERTEEIVQRVLALLPPQRWAPTEQELFTTLDASVSSVYGFDATVAVDKLTELYNAQPTVVEAKAANASEVIEQVRNYMIQDGVNDGCEFDLWLANLANSYQSEAHHG